jgi:hypothetical protein
LFGINAEGLADAILMAKEKGEKNDWMEIAWNRL